MMNSSSDKVRGKLKGEMNIEEKKVKAIAGVQEEVRTHMRVGRNDLRFGIVEDRFVKAHWFLGNAGRCEWIMTKCDSRMIQKGDPQHAKREEDNLVPTMESCGVDVVFFGGRYPPKDGRFWRNDDLKGVAWVTKRRAIGAVQIPKGWDVVASKRVTHSNVGGVTDATLWVEVAVKKEGGLRWQPQTEFVGNVLKQVVNPTIGGRNCLPVKDSRHERKNTALGTLEWKNRFGMVTVPTVYSKDKWAKRKLSAKELSNALDLPGHLTGSASSRQIELMAQVEIPGKILQCAFQGLWRDDEVTGSVSKQAGKRRALDHSMGAQKKARADTDVPRDTKENEKTSTESSRLSKLVEGQDSTITDKAVKSDDARVQFHLWNLKAIEGCKWTQEQFVKTAGFRKRCFKSFDVLRLWLLGLWKKRVERSFHVWFHNTEHVSDTREDLRQLGEEAIRRARRCDWWQWNGGSSIFFWRWLKPCQQDAAFGAKARLDKEPPRFWNAQPPIDTEKKRQLIQPKVDKVLQNGCVKLASPNSLRSLLHMFDVLKGNEDIRLVYDGSKSGLNESLWSPWFALPTVETMCRTLEPGHWCADNDYGDQFLNFPLQPCPKRANKTEDLLTAVWTRNTKNISLCFRSRRVTSKTNHDGG